MFKLRDKDDDSIVTIYKVKTRIDFDGEDRVEFLIYTHEHGFVWNDSSYFEPIE